MRRRSVLWVLLAAPASRAHTPFQQWVVYRRKHLLIGTNKADAGSYELGKQLVVQLAEKLPESKPRTARAPNAERLASLLTTEQLLVVLLRPEDALNLRLGKPPFAAFGPFDVRLLADMGAYYLVSSPVLPDHHAWLICKALAPVAARAKTSASIPYHAGAERFLSGGAMPRISEVDEPGRSHEH